MGNGWICLHRSLQEHWVYDDPIALKAWICILLTANHKETKVLFDGELLPVKKGQFLTSVRKFAEKVGCSRRKAENMLELFERDKMIHRERHKKGTLLSVVNYSVYQDMRASDDASECTSESTNDVTQTTMINNDKQEREETTLAPVRITRFSTGKFDNVYLSSDEAARLMSQLGETVARKTIDALSEYMYTHKHKYTDDGHYAVIMKWAKEDKHKYSDQEGEDINARQREEWKRIDSQYGIG